MVCFLYGDDFSKETSRAVGRVLVSRRHRHMYEVSQSRFFRGDFLNDLILLDWIFESIFEWTGLIYSEAVRNAERRIECRVIASNPLAEDGTW